MNRLCNILTWGCCKSFCAWNSVCRSWDTNVGSDELFPVTLVLWLPVNGVDWVGRGVCFERVFILYIVAFVWIPPYDI